MTPYELQTALYQRLTGFTALTDLLAGDPRFSATPAVYDHVPQDAEYPYIVIGEDFALDWDTDTTTGSDTEITIHTWSRFRGRGETKKIQRQIYNALHRHDLLVTGADTVTVEFEDSRTLLDEDGLTRHGATTFRVLLEDT